MYFKKQAYLKPIFFLFLLWLIYFWKVIFLGQVFYLGDNSAFDIPHRIFFVNSVRNGEIPLWNPYLLSGIPFLLIGSHGLVNPSTLLFFVFSPEVAMTFATIFNILFAGVFMSLFVFLISRQKTSSFLAGLIYMFSGFAVNSTQTIITAQELPLFPLAFITLQLAIDKSKKFLAVCGLILALEFTSGFPFVPYLTVIGLLIYYFYNSWETVMKKITAFLIIGFFALGFASFTLIPQFELMKSSTRPINNYQYATSSSLQSSRFITFFLPHFFGIPEIEIGQNTRNRPYLGIIPVIAIFYAILRKRRLLNKGILAITLVGFSLSFGRYFPLYRLLLIIPGLSFFREPEFFLLLYIFGGSIIAGIVLADFSKNFNLSKQKIFRRIPLLFSIIIILFAGYAYIYFADISKFMFGFLPAKTEKIRSLLLINLDNWLVLVGILFVSAFFLAKIKTRKCIFLFITFVIFLDLYYLNQSEIFLVSYEKHQQIFKKPPWLSKLTTSYPDYRLHSLISLNPHYENLNSRENYLLNRLRENNLVLFPNLNLIPGISSVDGFSPLVLKNYIHYLASDPQNKLVGITNFDIEPDSPKLAGAAAKYLISDTLVKKYYSPRYKLLDYSSGKYYLYEDTLAKKRAYLLNNKGKETGEARIISSRNNSVTLITNSAEKVSLILLDNYYPGWEVTVDGRKTDLKLFNNTFRQVHLSAGNHLVVFKFFPKSLIFGLIITIITLIIYIRSYAR